MANGQQFGAGFGSASPPPAENDPSVGQSFFHKINPTLEKVEELTGTLAAGFARDPRERERQSRLLLIRRQGRKEEFAKRLDLTDKALRNLEPFAKTFSDSGKPPGPAFTKTVSTAVANYQRALVRSGVAPETAMTMAHSRGQTLLAIANKPTPFAGKVKQIEQVLGEAGGVPGAAGARGSPGTPPLSRADIRSIAGISTTNPNLVLQKIRTEAGNQDIVLIDKSTGKIVQRFVGGPTVQFQPPGLPGARSKDVTRLEESEIATRNALGTALSLQDLIRKGGPGALSAPGAIASLAINLRANVQGFAQITGVDVGSFEDGADISTADARAEGIFRELNVSATMNAQIKSTIVNLAFAAAAASAQTGRAVSDKDYERFVRELAANASDPKIFTTVIDRFTERINRNFQNRFIVQSRRIPGLKGKAPPDILKELRPKKKQSVVNPKAADFPEGSILTGRDGKQWEVRGGKFVPLP